MKAQLALIGLPGVGKTTLANELGKHLGLPVLHTDDFKELPWAEQADAAMAAAPVRGIIEGVTVARMFRRGFHPDCVVHVTGGDNPSMLTLTLNGIVDYERACDSRGYGRVIYLPVFADLDTMLFMLGQPDE